MEGKHCQLVNIPAVVAGSIQQGASIKKQTISRTCADLQPEVDLKYTGSFSVWLLHLGKHFVLVIFGFFIDK